METLFEEKLRKNMDLVATCDTIEQFIDELKLDRDQVRDYLRKFEKGEYWHNLFHTFKNHGWQSKALALPHITNLKELITGARLGERGKTPHNTYMGGTRSSIGITGYFNCNYYIKVRKNGEFWCYGVGGNHEYISTYVTPSDRDWETD